MKKLAAAGNLPAMAISQMLDSRKNLSESPAYAACVVLAAVSEAPLFAKFCLATMHIFADLHPLAYALACQLGPSLLGRYVQAFCLERGLGVRRDLRRALQIYRALYGSVEGRYTKAAATLRELIGLLRAEGLAPRMVSGSGVRWMEPGATPSTSADLALATLPEEEPVLHFFEPVACSEMIPKAFHHTSLEVDFRRAGRYALLLLMSTDTICLDYAGLYG